MILKVIKGLFGLLPLEDWLIIGALALAIFYHLSAVESAKIEQKRTDDSSWTAKIDQANKDAKEDHDQMQAKLDAKADEQNGQIHADIARIDQSIKTIGARYAPSKPLPADCRFDDERVRMANAALGH